MPKGSIFFFIQWHFFTHLDLPGWWMVQCSCTFSPIQIYLDGGWFNVLALFHPSKFTGVVDGSMFLHFFTHLDLPGVVDGSMVLHLFAHLDLLGGGWFNVLALVHPSRFTGWWMVQCSCTFSSLQTYLGGGWFNVLALVHPSRLTVVVDGSMFLHFFTHLDLLEWWMV